MRSHCLQAEFSKMMKELQDNCNSQISDMSESAVQQGEAYACLESDGIWYRVVVEQLLGDSGFKLYRCDYGDSLNVNSSTNLKFLASEFRKLPQLAMSAGLYGNVLHMCT